KVNRAEALVVSAAEFMANGKEYVGQIVSNAKALGKALNDRGVTVLGAHKDYTETHQVIVDVSQYGGGYDVAQRLAEANIITNKNLIPKDRPEDWDESSGLRIGTTEMKRYGMKEQETEYTADLIDSLNQK